MYLNAEVYTGTPRYTEAITYCNKVINAGYTLHGNYKELMLADNHLNTDEFIFVIAYDGTYTQNWGGTTYLTHGPAAVPGSVSGTSGNWGGLRGELAEQGVVFDMMFASLMFNNVHGGFDTGFFGAGPLGLAVTLDMEQLCDIEGGKLLFDWEFSHWLNGRFGAAPLDPSHQLSDREGHSRKSGVVMKQGSHRERNPQKGNRQRPPASSQVMPAVSPATRCSPAARRAAAFAASCERKVSE